MAAGSFVPFGIVHGRAMELRALLCGMLIAGRRRTLIALANV
jgi:hypothetical protein